MHKILCLNLEGLLGSSDGGERGGVGTSGPSPGVAGGSTSGGDGLSGKGYANQTLRKGEVSIERGNSGDGKSLTSGGINIKAVEMSVKDMLDVEICDVKGKDQGNSVWMVSRESRPAGHRGDMDEGSFTSAG